MSETAEAIIEALALRQMPHGVKLGRMFGLRCLLLGRRPLVVLSGDDLVFRIPFDLATDALTIPGASAWQPMPGRGLMKEWIIIPVDAIEVAEHWANISLSYVQSM